MLKPGKDPIEEAGDEQSIGEVVSQLIDEGKAYAKAEVDLAKATALAKLGELKTPAILLFSALLFAQAAVTVLAVAVALGLAPLLGPFGAGLVAVALAGGIAALLGWIGVKRLQGLK